MTSTSPCRPPRQRRRHPSTQPTAVAQALPGELTVEQIALTDPEMRRLLNEREVLDEQLARLTLRGLGSAHREVLAIRQSLERLNGRIQKYLEDFRTYHAATGQSLGDPMRTPVDTRGKSLQVLQYNKRCIGEMLQVARREMMETNQKRIQFQKLDRDINRAEAELAIITKRIETLTMESSMGGRLSVVSTGEMALIPEKDNRIRLAAAGGSAGFMLPAGVVFLISLARRRYRYSEETESDAILQAPLLGVLPRLKENLSDSEQTMCAALCVHQIRVALQAQAPRSGCCIYLMTSAASGEGKTGLTMALGLSFAATRLRTLIVDGDWVGRGMTQKLAAEDQDGLYESLATGDARPFIRRTANGLHVLTSGRVRTAEACAISANSLRPVLQQMRDDYDIVIVDTGPILGSVEASVLAREVDGVIFTIARRQHRTAVSRALRKLGSRGVNLAGFIFNQAKLRDFRRSSYASTRRSSSDGSNGDSRPGVGFEEFSGFGPVAQVVAQQAPASDRGER